MSHCAHCPMAADARCQGEVAPRLCELVDPAHPDHRPGYEASIVEASRVEYPPVAEQAGNLARSLWDWACSGFKMASEAEQARRLAICEAPCSEWLPLDRRCGKCTCFMDAKVQLKTAKCPIGKW